MILDLFFRNYYFGLYDSLRLLHQRIFDPPAIVISEVEKKWSLKIDNVLEEERKPLEKCEEEIIIRRARVEHIEGIKSYDQGDRNQWRKKFPVLPVWRQKAKKHVGKRFGSKVDLDMSKKTKIEDPLICCSPAQRVRLLSTSECRNNDEQDNAEGSGQAPSALELVSIVTVLSLVKSREEEGVDSRAFRDLEELRMKLLLQEVRRALKSSPNLNSV